MENCNFYQKNIKMREPQLGIAVGKRGIGKTHTTLEIINQYLK